MNQMHGDERIVFENTANSVRHYTWFVDPFVDPTMNDILLEKLWASAAGRLRLAMKMTGNAKTFVIEIPPTLHGISKLTLAFDHD